MPSKPLPPSGAQYWKPKKQQVQAMRAMIEAGALALWARPGGGKTSVSLGVIKVLKEMAAKRKGTFRRALVIAPRRPANLVWPREQQKWADFHGIKLSVLHGDKKEERSREASDVCVITPEGLEWLLGIEKSKAPGAKRATIKINMQRFKSFGFDTLIIDESSKFRHHDTLRTRILREVFHLFRRRYELTASPAPNGLEGLYSQAYLLDGGRALGRFITHYRANYFVQGYDGRTYTLQAGAEKKIYARMKPLVFRLTAGRNAKEPRIEENDIKVQLPQKARDAYRDMERDLITKIKRKVVVAANAGVASAKCRQITGGAVYEDWEPGQPQTGRKWHNLHDEKLEALCDLVDELQGTPLLVAYEFNHELERLRELFGVGRKKELPYIGAGTSDKRADELERLWNAGKLPILLGHPQSMGHGLNLQTAHNTFESSQLCWLTTTWDWELYFQFNGRVSRNGNKHEVVTVHRIIAENTVDESVCAALRFKEKSEAKLLEFMEGRAAGDTSAAPEPSADVLMRAGVLRAARIRGSK